MVVREANLPKLKKLFIYGVLEFDQKEDGTGPDYILSCAYIVILGGRLIVGWEGKPYLGKMEIILRGDHKTPPLDDIQIGAKAIGESYQLASFKICEVFITIFI